MSVNGPKGEGLVVTGVVACGDGTIHSGPRRCSGGKHSFGAAAVRDPSTGEVAVTLYTEVRGRRPGELTYTAGEWDTHFVGSLRVAREQGDVFGLIKHWTASSSNLVTGHS